MLLKKQRLPLPHHAQHMIVDDDLYDRDVVAACRRQFVHIHAETSVTGNVHTDFVRHADLCADAGAKPVAHRAESAGREEGARFRILIILCCPHLVLSDIGGDDRFPRCHAVKLLDDVRTGQLIRLVPQGVFFLERFDLCDPLTVILPFQLAVEFLQDSLEIPDEGGVRPDILVDLCSIDVYM